MYIAFDQAGMSRKEGEGDKSDSIMEQLGEVTDNPVFQDKSILDPEKVIDEDRIVGRDDQLDRIIQYLRPALEGMSPPNLLLYGPSGTGKSLIINTVSQNLQQLADAHGTSIGVLNINCQNISSHDRSVHALVDEAAKQAGVEPDIPLRGIATDQKLDRLFELFNNHFDTVIIVLDEVDLLRNPNQNNSEEPVFSKLLYQLSRTKQLSDADTNVCVASLTNDPGFMNELDGRAESSFNPDDIVFQDYTSDQLEAILERRDDAYYDGVLQRDVIPTSAELAAQDHGDARKAIDLFRKAGELAVRGGEGRVRVEHVREAQDVAERDRALIQMRGLSIHKQVALYATVRVAVKDNQLESVPSPIGFEVYKDICELLDQDSKSRDTYLRYMNEAETYNFVRSLKTGKGYQAGAYKEFKFVHSPEAVVETLEADELLDPVQLHTDEISELVEEEVEQFFQQQ
jgi:cell division control protein 6